MELPFPESGGLWVDPVAGSVLCPLPESPMLTPTPASPGVRVVKGESEESAPPRPLGRKGAPRAWPQDDTTLNNFSAEFCNGHPLSASEGSGVL